MGGYEITMLGENFIEKFKSKIQNSKLFDEDVVIWEDLLFSCNYYEDNEEYKNLSGEEFVELLILGKVKGSFFEEDEDIDIEYRRKIIKDCVDNYDFIIEGYDSFTYFVRCVYVGDGELERFEEEFEFLCDDDNSENEKIEYVRNWFSNIELSDDEVRYIINFINSMNEWYNGY